MCSDKRTERHNFLNVLGHFFVRGENFALCDITKLKENPNLLYVKKMSDFLKHRFLKPENVECFKTDFKLCENQT